jgi:hypothetical protein
MSTRPSRSRSERIKVAAGQMLRELTLLGFANMMDYRRIGGILGCSAILQNLRKPEIQAALQELVAARSQRTRISRGVARGVT